MTKELQDYINHLFDSKATKLHLELGEAESKEEEAFLRTDIKSNHKMKNEFGKDHSKYLAMN